MYRNKKILALIPARGGSKGIPNKNITDLCGKPLITYTIDAGLGSKYIDYLMVSTDNEEIAKISVLEGAEVPFIRPSDLAADGSKTIDVAIHAIETLRAKGKVFDTLLLLQPTQPLRTKTDIDRAIERYMESECQPMASVSLVDDHPMLIRSISRGVLIPLLDKSSTCRRQDMPAYYRVNGCIYINEITSIDKNTSFNDNRLPFVMEDSHSVDIDSYKDLAVAEFFLRYHKHT